MCCTVIGMPRHFYGKSGFVPGKTKGVRYADDPEADYFLIKERPHINAKA